VGIDGVTTRFAARETSAHAAARQLSRRSPRCQAAGAPRGGPACPGAPRENVVPSPTLRRRTGSRAGAPARASRSSSRYRDSAISAVVAVRTMLRMRPCSACIFSRARLRLSGVPGHGRSSRHRRTRDLRPSHRERGVDAIDGRLRSGRIKHRLTSEDDVPWRGAGREGEGRRARRSDERQQSDGDSKLVRGHHHH
jgi:hypothetical protein